MEIITTVEAMHQIIKQVKKQGKSIGLVPTMGALHDGHLELLRRAKSMCDVTVTSIFVNPTQFGPTEDFNHYPRDFANDCAKAKSTGIDIIFHPAAAEMYPEGYATFVNVDGNITDKLCGLSRPGHFRGVATIVSKLFNIIQPDKAFFGQKDAQQVVVIKRMVEDLNMSTTIEIVPIVRAADGLALSSRNTYLSSEERNAALVLSRSLKLAEQAVKAGQRDLTQIRRLVVNEIGKEKLAGIDYVEIYHFPGLEPIEQLTNKALLALAVKIGKTRLIDNTILEVATC